MTLRKYACCYDVLSNQFGSINEKHTPKYIATEYNSDVAMRADHLNLFWRNSSGYSETESKLNKAGNIYITIL